jgi:hypothetical protein
LQRRSQPGGDDVGNALAFERGQDRLVEEAAVGTQEADGLVAQMMQGRFEKLQDVVGAPRMARPQPEVGHHARFGDKGQERMMARPALPAGVIAARGTLLFSVAGDDRGIDVQGHLLQCGDLAEEPAVGLGLHPFVGEPVEAGEQPHDGLVSGRPGPAEQAGERAVHAHRLGMHEPAGAAPDGDDELLDQLRRFVAPVRLGRWQSPPGDRLPELHAVEHALEQRQPAPCRDLSGGKLTEKPSPANNP